MSLGRPATLLWLLLLVVAVVATAVFATLYLRPTQDDAFPDGPVLVLGGNPERAAFADDLVPVATADRPVWISWGASGWAAAGRSCDEPHVTCFGPQPVSTWGEAQAAASLADREGWQRLTVVTSAFHRARSASLVSRCLDIPVVVTGPPADGEGGAVPWRLAVREAGATLVSAVRYRDC